MNVIALPVSNGAEFRKRSIPILCPICKRLVRTRKLQCRGRETRRRKGGEGDYRSRERGPAGERKFRRKDAVVDEKPTGRRKTWHDDSLLEAPLQRP